MDELCQRFSLMVQKIMNHVDNETLINFKEAGRNNATFLEKERFYWIRIIQRYNCLYGELHEVWRKFVRKTPVEIIKELAVAVYQFPWYQTTKNIEPKLMVNETTPSVYVSENIGDMNAFKILLDHPKDINWCHILGKYLMHPNLCIKLHILGRIPFCIAASKRHLDVCRFFMEKCVDENHMSTLLIIEQIIFIMQRQCDKFLSVQ